MKKNITKRRTRALLRLEEQLKVGKKPNKGTDSILTVNDIKRINTEIGILNTSLIGTSTDV